MVNSGKSFLRDIISDVFKEINIVDGFSVAGEIFFDGSNLLGREEDAKGVKEQIEGML